ncbi:MAG: protein kinase [Gemmatimonadetes bacterium]|nr:protein kinase [Gemmatimonadota bacterium]
MTTGETELDDPEREAVREALADRYAVESAIGRGATAVVYRAQDLRHDRPVALKVLSGDVAAGFGSDRFLREIGLVARLQHPHIVPIYDSGSAGDLLYYVMPFIEGESLREKLERERHIGVAETLRLVLEVAEALSFAHSRGIVHRDIKPENILLFRGHAMTADFGIAKVTAQAEQDNLTLDGMGLGTPVYMSPEQALGEPALDGRADLYSLGCVMFEMLEGRAPFTGRSLVELLARKATQDAPQLQDRAAEVPEHVAEALQLALHRDPSGRFATLSEFSDALTRSTPAQGRASARRLATPPAHSLAVLPFEDRSATADSEFLSDGITEDLISALSRVDGLRVVARSSSFSFKGTTRDVKDVAAELGVTSVLAGSVRRSGSRVRITSDLVNGQDGFTLWSERFDRELTDVFDVQDEISRSIVTTLTATILGGQKRLVEAPTASMEAYQAYLKGRFEWNERTEPSLRRALEHLEEAVKLDPGFALAHAGLADARLGLAIYGVGAPAQLFPAARADVERALQLDADSAEALTARASVRAYFDHDWEGAERDYRAALAVREQYATAHQWYAMHLLGPRGRFDEVRVRLARARELDPLSAAIGASGGLIRYFEGDHEQALSEFALVLAQHPRFGLAHFGRGLALSALGRDAESAEALQAALLVAGLMPEIVSVLAFVQARAGDTAAARRALASLEELSATRYVSPALLAQVHMGLGDRARALDLLEAALAARATEITMIGYRHPFAELRDDPRFVAIRTEIGV